MYAHQQNYAAATLDARPISLLSDHQLEVFEHVYRESGFTKCACHPLAAVTAERCRRVAGGLTGSEIVQLILDMSQQNSDGYTTYLALYRAVFPGKPWRGTQAIKQVLHQAIIYCVDNDLPMVTALVVRSDTRELSRKALQNIYRSARDLGVSVGSDASDFVTTQILLSFDLFNVTTNLFD